MVDIINFPPGSLSGSNIYKCSSPFDKANSIAAAANLIFVRDTNKSCSVWENNGAVVADSSGPTGYDDNIPWQLRVSSHPANTDFFNETDNDLDYIDTYVGYSDISRDHEFSVSYYWKSARFCLAVQNAAMSKSPVASVQANGQTGPGRFLDLSKASIKWYQARNIAPEDSLEAFESRPFIFPTGKKFISRKNFISYSRLEEDDDFWFPPPIKTLLFANDGERIGARGKAIHGLYDNCDSDFPLGHTWDDVFYADPEGGELTLFDPTAVAGAGEIGGNERGKDSEGNCIVYDNPITTRDPETHKLSYDYHYTNGYVFDTGGAGEGRGSCIIGDEGKTILHNNKRVAGIGMLPLKPYTRTEPEDYEENCLDSTVVIYYPFDDTFLLWGDVSENCTKFISHIESELPRVNLWTKSIFLHTARLPALGTAFDFVAVFDVCRRATFYFPKAPGRGDCENLPNKRVRLSAKIVDDDYYRTDLQFLAAAQLVPVPPKQPT